jgi:hypothetical protein
MNWLEAVGGVTWKLCVARGVVLSRHRHGTFSLGLKSLLAALAQDSDDAFNCSRVGVVLACGDGTRDYGDYLQNRVRQSFSYNNTTTSNCDHCYHSERPCE